MTEGKGSKEQEHPERTNAPEGVCQETANTLEVETRWKVLEEDPK